MRIAAWKLLAGERWLDAAHLAIQLARRHHSRRPRTRPASTDAAPAPPPPVTPPYRPIRDDWPKPWVYDFLPHTRRIVRADIRAERWRLQRRARRVLNHALRCTVAFTLADIADALNNNREALPPAPSAKGRSPL